MAMECVSGYYRDEEGGSGGRKKYVVPGAVGAGVAAALLLAFFGMLDASISDGPAVPPRVDGDKLSVFTYLPEMVVEGPDVPVPDAGVPVPEEGLPSAGRGAAGAVQEDGGQGIAGPAAGMPADDGEGFGPADGHADNNNSGGGLTMGDMLGNDPPDPEDAAGLGADILKEAEEFKKASAEPIPDGAVSGTVTWVLTGNTINVNGAIIRLTGVPPGGAGDRDGLMRECPRDTLALYTLDGRTDSEGGRYGKVWCYGYPPTPPEASVNDILR